jgi:hypothetical protein
MMDGSSRERTGSPSLVTGKTMSYPFNQTKYYINKDNNIYLSAISGEGTYSDSDSVEIAILDNALIRYDLIDMGVHGYFSRDKLQHFVDWLIDNINLIETKRDNEDDYINLPQMFLEQESNS